MNHTKSPWRVTYDKTFSNSITTRDKDGELRPIATVSTTEKYPSDYKENIANTKLIVAAPKLLETLENLIKQHDLGLDCTKEFNQAKEVLNKINEPIIEKESRWLRKHTPGQWTSKGSDIYTTDTEIPIAHVHNQTEYPATANIKLITAAPNLLESLQTAHKVLSFCLSHLHKNNKVQWIKDAIKSAEETLTKAKHDSYE